VLYSTRKMKEVGKGTVTLEGGISLKSGKLSKTLGTCDTATVFLATIGSDIDGVIKDLSGDNKLSDAYLYDAIGSVAVEAAVDDFQNRFDLTLSDRRESTTARFSPGYCDWNIEEQAKIFDILDGEAAGVSLSPSFLMNPRKSVSGVFGIAPGPAEARPNPCTMCSKESCIARR
jgi:cobalamin-dependent methionine synthase I